MKFEEVLPALREGKKVRRASFRERVVELDSFNGQCRNPLYRESLMADDWEIFEEPKKNKVKFWIAVSFHNDYKFCLKECDIPTKDLMALLEFEREFEEGEGQ